MPDIYDYMAWRGDIGIDQDGFNEVDNLVLSAFAYVPLDGLVPPGGISIGEAARLFAARPELHKLLRMQKDKRLFEEVGRCPRFARLKLRSYVNIISEREETQFAAVTVETGDGGVFVAYRGTDNTLVGWKEDFNMGFMRHIPAQSSAVAYLEDVAAGLGASFNGPLRVGGHSKGGNLAVYASAFCSRAVQDKITAVYNNDGPWLHAELAGQPEYLAVCDRLEAFIPQTSIVGMLLEHEGRYSVIRSNQKGLFQHCIYSWQVAGPGFVRLDTVTRGSEFVDRTVKTWLAECSEEQRAMFVEALFSIISAGGARTFQEMRANRQRNALAMLKAYIGLDKNVRKVMGRALRLFVKAAYRHAEYITPSNPLKRRKIAKSKK